MMDLRVIFNLFLVLQYTQRIFSYTFHFTLTFIPQFILHLNTLSTLHPWPIQNHQLTCLCTVGGSALFLYSKVVQAPHRKGPSLNLTQELSCCEATVLNTAASFRSQIIAKNPLTSVCFLLLLCTKCCFSAVSKSPHDVSKMTKCLSLWEPVLMTISKANQNSVITIT